VTAVYSKKGSFAVPLTVLPFTLPPGAGDSAFDPRFGICSLQQKVHFFRGPCFFDMPDHIRDYFAGIVKIPSAVTVALVILELPGVNLAVSSGVRAFTVK
jgi:hypothetical protein